MSPIMGWEGTVNYPQTLSAGNTGTIAWGIQYPQNTDMVVFDILGTYNSVQFTFVWAPVTLGDSPSYSVQDVDGTFFTGGSSWTTTATPLRIKFSGSSPAGTLTITAVVDGVAAVNSLKIAVSTTSYAYYFGGPLSQTGVTAAWSATAASKFWTQLVGVVES